MHVINTIPHGKCFVRYLRTRCFCIRNLTRSLRSLVRFLIRQQLVRKYRTPALSMKYSLCLKFFYTSHSNRKWISFSTLFDEESWHILRFSGILGRWYQSVSILNLWLLHCNFAPAWRCFSFLIRSKYSDLLTSVLKVEFIEFKFFCKFATCSYGPFWSNQW